MKVYSSIHANLALIREKVSGFGATMREIKHTQYNEIYRVGSLSQKKKDKAWKY